jgi:hypothetical protein
MPLPIMIRRTPNSRAQTRKRTVSMSSLADFRRVGRAPKGVFALRKPENDHVRPKFHRAWP